MTWRLFKIYFVKFFKVIVFLKISTILFLFDFSMMNLNETTSLVKIKEHLKKGIFESTQISCFTPFLGEAKKGGFMNLSKQLLS